MRGGFSLIELLIAIALAGAMAIFATNYIDTSVLSKESIKTKFQSHLNVITSAVLQCKELSNVMPLEANGSLANDSLLNSLECNTSTTYMIDGGQGSFIPPPLDGFSEYKATQNGSEFYVSISVDLDSVNADVLLELNTTYSSQQYILTEDTSYRYLNFYISR